MLLKAPFGCLEVVDRLCYRILLLDLAKVHLASVIYINGIVNVLGLFTPLSIILHVNILDAFLLANIIHNIIQVV